MSRPATQMQSREPASEQETTDATIAAGDAIANVPMTVELGDGREVEIRRCKVLQISRVLRLVSDFFNDLKVTKVGDLPQIDLQNPSIILQLFANYADQVFEVTSLLTSLDEKEMRDLDMDDAILVVREVWLLNQNFFLEKILPLVQQLIPVVATAPVDDDSLSPKTESSKTSSTKSSSSSGTASRRKRSKTSR
jgi:hypothetical protein